MGLAAAAFFRRGRHGRPRQRQQTYHQNQADDPFHHSTVNLQPTNDLSTGPPGDASHKLLSRPGCLFLTVNHAFYQITNGPGKLAKKRNSNKNLPTNASVGPAPGQQKML